MSCPLHPHHRITGICAFCLRERLVDLIQSISLSEAQAAAEAVHAEEEEAEEDMARYQANPSQENAQKSKLNQLSFHGNAENLPPFVHHPSHHHHHHQSSPYYCYKENASCVRTDAAKNANVSQKAKKASSSSSSWFASSKAWQKKPGVASAAGSAMRKADLEEGSGASDLRSPLQYISNGRKSASDAICSQSQCHYREAFYRGSMDGGVSESMAMANPEATNTTNSNNNNNNSSYGYGYGYGHGHNKLSWISSLFSRKKKRGANNSADHHRRHHLRADEEEEEEVFRMNGHEAAAMAARLSLDGAKAHHLKQSFMKKLEEERINMIKAQKQQEEDNDDDEEEEEREFGIGGAYCPSSLRPTNCGVIRSNVDMVSQLHGPTNCGVIRSNVDMASQLHGPTNCGMIRSNVDMVSQLHVRPAKQPHTLPKCISLGVPSSAQDQQDTATRYCCHHVAATTASPIVVVPPPRFFHHDDQQHFRRHQQLCCGGDMEPDYDENLNNNVVVGEEVRRRSFPRSRSWGSRVMAWGLKNHNKGVPVIPSPSQGHHHHYHHHNPSSTTTTPYHY